MATPERFVIQQIFNQTYKNVQNTEILGSVDDLKNMNVENNQETVFSMGGVGNAYLTAHSHSKRTTGTATAATYRAQILGLITGSDVVDGATTIPVNGEEVTVTSDAATLEFTPIGTTNLEMKGLYYKNADGTRGDKLEQAATVSAGKYTLTGKALAFDASEIADDTVLLAYYEATSDTTAKSIANEVNKFSKIVRIEMDTLVQDVCTGDEFAAVLIIYKAKLTGSYSMDLAADGDPASLDVSFEGLKEGCGGSKLSELKIYESLT